jgi:hypothetical protein
LVKKSVFARSISARLSARCFSNSNARASVIPAASWPAMSRMKLRYDYDSGR